MKYLAAVLALVALAGCIKNANNATGDDLVSMGVPTQTSADQAARDCRFESNKATAAINSGIEQGIAKQRVFEDCISAKGYRVRQG